MTKAKSRSITQRTFHEVFNNEPGIVGHTRKKFGAKRAKAQKIAIALSKARRLGANIKGQ